MKKVKVNAIHDTIANHIDANASIKEGLCAWPIGDIMDDDFSFCRANRCGDSPYCDEHERMAYSNKKNKEIKITGLDV